MKDLIVVGSGFWGTATATLAKERGLDVLVIDCEKEDGASRVAAGIICWKWYQGEHIQKMMPAWFKMNQLEYCKQFLTNHYGLQHTGEQFQNGQTGGTHFRKDCWLLPCPRMVLGSLPHLKEEVRKLDRSRQGWVVETNRNLHEAKRIVFAVGHHTDVLLSKLGIAVASGVRGLVGRAFILKGVTLETPITRAATMYMHFTARPWETCFVRVGDTVEKKEDQKHLDRLQLEIANMLPGKKYTVQQTLRGVRPVADKFFVELVSPGIVAATGGHRVGLGIAPMIAHRALSLLGV